jgi:hypothetical protein
LEAITKARMEGTRKPVESDASAKKRYAWYFVDGRLYFNVVISRRKY